MNRHTSLTAYHQRRRTEAAVELERVRRSNHSAREIPVICDRRHIGPGTALLIGLGALVVLGAILNSND